METLLAIIAILGIGWLGLYIFGHVVIWLQEFAPWLNAAVLPDGDGTKYLIGALIFAAFDVLCYIGYRNKLNEIKRR